MPLTPIELTSSVPSKVGAEVEVKLTFKLRAVESLSAEVALAALSVASSFKSSADLIAFCVIVPSVAVPVDV